LALTSEKKFYDQVAKKLKKYEKAPPTVMEFLSNPYYLGEETQGGERIFPYWKVKLQELYPTPFYEYDPDKKIILLTGATGIGKCVGYKQEVEVYMSEEDIKKYGLEDYVEE
jgi:hypothetical protein